MAPECMRENNVELAKGFDTGADVYSFAMVLWEVAHPGRIPWQGESFELSDSVDITTAIRNAVLEGRRPAVKDVEEWPPGYQDLMRKCWNEHSDDRPRFLSSFFDEDIIKPDRTGQTIGSILRRMIWETRS